MEAASSSFTIPDFVGPIDLTEIPQDRRLRHLQQACAKLGRRPVPKTASVRDRHEEELSAVMITINLAERALEATSQAASVGLARKTANAAEAALVRRARASEPPKDRVIPLAAPPIRAEREFLIPGSAVPPAEQMQVRYARAAPSADVDQAEALPASSGGQVPGWTPATSEIRGRNGELWTTPQLTVAIPQAQRRDILQDALNQDVPREVIHDAGMRLVRLSANVTENVMPTTEEEEDRLIAAHVTQGDLPNMAPDNELAVALPEVTLPRHISYIDALNELQSKDPSISEYTLLSGGLGTDVTELEFVLEDTYGLSGQAIQVIVGRFPYRRRDFLHARKGGGELFRGFCYTTTRTTTSYLEKEALPLQALPPSHAYDWRVKRNRAMLDDKKIESAKTIRLTQAVIQRHSAAEVEEIRYTQLVMMIVVDARMLFEQLSLECFGIAPSGATDEQIARIYGPCIQSKVTGGKLQFSGCRGYWMRLVKLMDCATESGYLDVRIVLDFMDVTQLGGAIMGATCKWAADAFDNKLLMHLGTHKAVKTHKPVAKLGAVIKQKRAPKQAIWLCDDFVKFLMDNCHCKCGKVCTGMACKLRRARACFGYSCAFGGVRFADAQHVYSIVYLRPLGVEAEADRFKTSTDNEKEKFVMPLLDYKGRSLEPAFECLKEQMGSSYLLADPEPIGQQGVSTPIREPRRRCTYSHAIEIFQAFIAEFMVDFQVSASIHKNLDFMKGTMHSLKGWLATLAAQARFTDDETDRLLHWNKKAMRKRYNHNTSSTELSLRLQVMRLLAYPGWESRGPGLPQVPMTVAQRESLPPLLNEPSNGVDQSYSTYIF